MQVFMMGFQKGKFTADYGEGCQLRGVKRQGFADTWHLTPIFPAPRRLDEARIRLIVLRKHFLRAADAFGHLHAEPALYRARGAVAAAHRGQFHWQFLKVVAAQFELAVALGIHHVAKHVRHRQALGAMAVALAAHPAIERGNEIQLPGQKLFFLGRIRLSVMAFRFSSS